MIWFTVFIIALGFELMTTALISIWFAIGALFAIGAYSFGASMLVQSIIFITVSVMALVLTKPYVEKRLLPKKDVSKTNVDALVGQKCYVTSDISNVKATGEVRLNGNVWSARSLHDQEIPEGKLVVVEKIEGVKVIVSEIEEKIGGKEE